MCLIVLAIEKHPEYPLVILANRDEFYQRPTRPLHAWPEAPEMLAGKDLEKGGTWAAWHRDGRFAALTNIRRPGALQSGLRSRGEIPLEFIRRQISPVAYARQIEGMTDEYAPFNMIYGSVEQLYYISSDALTPIPLEKGFHGLSNAALDKQWPKVAYACRRLEECLRTSSHVSTEALFECMLRVKPFPDEKLPETGVPKEWERTLSAPFIVSKEYGTRSTLLLLVDREGRLQLSERTYKRNLGPRFFSERTYLQAS